jgi:hypothetical protein
MPVLLASCAGIPADRAAIPPAPTATALDDTPFFPQRRFQCGPAALATILVAAGVQTDPELLAGRVYLPGRRGSLQLELVAATRAHERLAYRIDGTMTALAAELAAGRPVLVLQNLGVAWIPRWHYAVVVGIDPQAHAVLLYSGTERQRRTPIELFLRTWARADFWGLVAVVPGDLPASVDRSRYFRAAADLEATGHAAAAARAWHAAARHWPQDPMPLFGMANATLAAGGTHEAIDLYRAVIARDDAFAAAWNNLAFALAAAGDAEDAVEVLTRALESTAADDQAALLLRRSREEIAAGILPARP